jgi:hypothetical protein
LHKDAISGLARLFAGLEGPPGGQAVQVVQCWLCPCQAAVISAIALQGVSGQSPMLQEANKRPLTDCACQLCLQVSNSSDVHTEAVCSPDNPISGGPSLCLVMTCLLQCRSNRGLCVPDCAGYTQCTAGVKKATHVTDQSDTPVQPA